jgi:hypothetical protein
MQREILFYSDRYGKHVSGIWSVFAVVSHKAGSRALAMNSPPMASWESPPFVIVHAVPEVECRLTSMGNLISQ